MQKRDCYNSLMVAEIGISVKIPACWSAWKNKHIIYYLSTAHAPHEEEPQSVTQRQRDGTETEPPVLLLWLPEEYAQYMNRVDKPDHMTMQNKSKKCMKWYRRVDTKLMITSLSSYCGCLCPVHAWSRQNRPHDNAKQIQKTHKMVQKSGHQTHGNQSV